MIVSCGVHRRVLEGNRTPPSDSYGQVLQQECRFPVVLCDNYKIRLLISWVILWLCRAYYRCNCFSGKGAFFVCLRCLLFDYLHSIGIFTCIL